jgi:hypothetical protein
MVSGSREWLATSPAPHLATYFCSFPFSTTQVESPVTAEQIRDTRRRMEAVPKGAFEVLLPQAKPWRIRQGGMCKERLSLACSGPASWTGIALAHTYYHASCLTLLRRSNYCTVQGRKDNPDSIYIYCLCYLFYFLVVRIAFSSCKYITTFRTFYCFLYSNLVLVACCTCCLAPYCSYWSRSNFSTLFAIIRGMIHQCDLLSK